MRLLYITRGGWGQCYPLMTSHQHNIIFFIFIFVKCRSLELFPTSLRSGAMGIQSFSSNVGAIIAPLVLLMGQPPSPIPYIVSRRCLCLARMCGAV